MPADDQITFARSLYELYSAAPDLKAEAPNVDLDPFLPVEDARWFAYAGTSHGKTEYLVRMLYNEKETAFAQPRVCPADLMTV